MAMKAGALAKRHEKLSLIEHVVAGMPGNRDEVEASFRRTSHNDSLGSGSGTASTQRTLDGNPPPRKDAGQQAADDIASRTVYVDLAPQAWAKAKAYGRAFVENTGEILTATGEAVHSKAALIDAKPVRCPLL